MNNVFTLAHVIHSKIEEMYIHKVVAFVITLYTPERAELYARMSGLPKGKDINGKPKVVG